MADATYQPKVYMKQGGNEQVIASGGEQTIESGGVETIESGGKVTAESGGEFEGQGGGFFDAQEGFIFYLGNTNNRLSAAKIGNYLMGRVNKIHIGQSQGAGGAGTSGVLSAMGGSSPPVLPSLYGRIILSIGGISANTASARLWSAHIGEEVYIELIGSMSTAEILIVASNSGFTGVSIEGGYKGSVGASHAALSAFLIRASATSNAWIRLACYTEGTWSIIDRNASGIVEYPAA